MRRILFAFFLFFPFISFSQWNLNPAINTPVSIQPNTAKEIKMLEDGNKKGTFILWKDYRNPATSPDVYIQRINAAGICLWTTNGVPACTNFSDQSTPDMCSDTCGGVIITFSDWRSGIERDIYAQRIDSNGIPLWTIDGVIVTDKPNREHCPRIIQDGAGGAIIVWEQQDQSTWLWDVWAQRINSSGAIVWPWGGIPVSTVNANRINAKIQSDKMGGAFITWQDYRNGLDYDIYAQHLDPLGNRLWGAGGVPVCTANGAQTSAKVDRDSVSGGIYASWVDARNGLDYDIYAQRLDLSGAPMWPINGVAVCNAPFNQSAQDMLSYSQVGGLIITWKDHRNGVDIDVYAQKISTAGIPQWTIDGVPISTAINDQINPNITSDGTGGAIIAWEDDRTTSVTSDIYSQRIDVNGVCKWAVNGISIGIAADKQAEPKNVSDGSGGCIYGFQDRRAGGTYDIYVHHISGCISNPSVTAFPTVICVGDTSTLTASGGTAYSWSPSTGLSCTNCASPNAYPNATTTYTVTVTDSCGTSTATVTLTVNQPSVNPPTILPANPTICIGDSINLQVSASSSYSWSPATGLSCTNCSNPIASPTATTTYIVSVTGSCSQGTASVTVTVAQPSASSPDITATYPTICSGDTTNLSVTPSSSYTWSPGSSLSCTNCQNPIATPASTTTYTVTVTGACSTGTGSVTITILPPPVLTHCSDQEICIPNSVQLSALGATYYNWSPSNGLSCASCSNPIVAPTTNTIYYIVASNGPGVGCKDSDSVIVSITDDCPDIYIPTGFSPNGDQNNDLYVVLGYTLEFDLVIYNRWGQVVFETKDQTVGWDGTYKGEKLQSGVYAYKLSIIDRKGVYSQKAGNITLMR